MKMLSRTFRFVILGVIVIVVVASCCYFPSILDTTPYAYVEIGHARTEIKRTYRTYVEWKNKGDFDKALAQVRDHHGKICICVVLDSGGKPYRHEFNNDCLNYDCPSPSPEKIKTVKVTKSKAADEIAARESIANDPNVSHRIQSPDPRDIMKVLGTLK